MTDYSSGFGSHQTSLLPTPGGSVNNYNGSNNNYEAPTSGYNSSASNLLNMNYGASSTNPSAMEETASQHYIIGDNLRAKAFYEDAIDEFTRAMHVQESLLSGTPTLAQTHYSLGLSYRATKFYSQALYHLNKAVMIYESQPKSKLSKSKKVTSEDTKEDEEKEIEEEKPILASTFTVHPFKKELTDCKLNIARTHHSHGVELQRGGDYDKSILEHRKALAIREHFLGRTHLETARTYYVIGCALSDRGDFDEALSELRRALRTRLLIFGREHNDTKEVVSNLGTVLQAKGTVGAEEIATYTVTVIQALDLENEGDKLCRKGDFANGMVCYRKALSLEEQVLGDMHPTTCDLYLRMADALGQLGDLESALVEYKSAIGIYERMMGKFHVKVADIYNKLAGILMEKGEYETALSFYAKAYGIFDAILGNHDDTKHAMMNLRLAAAKERAAKESMDLIKRAEEDFKMRQEEQRLQEEEMIKEQDAMMKEIGKNKGKTENGEKPTPPKVEVVLEDVI